MICPAAASADDAPKSALEQSNQLSLLKEKIGVLEAQNEIFRESAQDIQLMYLAALAFSGTFLITFLGVNVYFSSTKFEEERKSLESLYKMKSEAQLFKLEEALNHHVEEIKKTIPEIVKKQIDPLSHSIDKQSKKMLSEQLRVDLELKLIEIELTTTESTLVRYYIEASVLANKLEEDWRIGEYLLKVEKLLTGGARVTEIAISDMVIKLRGLPAHHEILVNRIESQILKPTQVAK